MRIKVETPIDDMIDQLLRRKMIYLNDGVKIRKLSKAMRQLRENGSLTVACDRRLRKSVIIIAPYIRFTRKRTLSGSIFDLIL